MGLREYMKKARESAKILVLTGLTGIVGGCFSSDDDLTGMAIASASIAKTAMESGRLYHGQPGPSALPSQVDSSQSRGYNGPPTESYFNITGDGTNYVDVDGTNVSKYVKKNPEMFKEGYSARVYNAKTREYKTITTGKFKENKNKGKTQ